MNYNKKTLHDVNVKGKTVIVRVDFNVPFRDGNISSDKRIVEALPTIKYLLEQECKIVLLSHLSRIKTIEDIESNKKTLLPVFENLKEKLPGVEMVFEPDNTSKDLAAKIKKMPASSIILLENTRYKDVDEKGKLTKAESKNDPKLGAFWASLGDVFVNDAFGTAHREHASNVGIAAKIKVSCIGYLVEKEISMLSKVANDPARPLVAIFGGVKISDKIQTIETLANIADKVLIGGAMTHTFWHAQGKKVGKSIIDTEAVDLANHLIEKYKDKLILPIDNFGATKFANEKPKKFKDSITDDYMGLDVGKKTQKIYKNVIKNAKTVIWNGPVGAFEMSNFQTGTLSILKSIKKYGAKNNIFSVIGGGDSAAAAISLGYEDVFSHISTGGGASLSFFSESGLPGIKAIQDK